MRILLLGGGGFLGGEMVRVLEDGGWDFYAPGRGELDVRSDDLEGFMEDYDPGVLVNCTAYTDVDRAESEREEAEELNAEVPERLAKMAKKTNSLLVHFSTDYVFGGEGEVPYTEESEPSPVNYYGEAKLAGERKIQEVGGRYWIIRTSFPFGLASKCFLQKILLKAEHEKSLKVVDDYRSAPTCFEELAERVVGMLGEERPSGIYHLVNEGSATKYEFAREAVKLAGLGARVEAVAKIGDTEGAVRAGDSTMVNLKLPKMRHWQEALEIFFKENY